MVKQAWVSLAIGALTLASSLLAGCGGPSAPPSPAVGEVGTPLDLGRVTLTVSSAQLKDQVGDRSFPAPGQIFLLGEVQLENKSSYRFPYQRYHFSLVDATGASYDPAAVPGESKPLTSGDLEPQKDVTGNLLFRVPASATGFMLNYRVPGTDQVARVRLGEPRLFPTPTQSPTPTLTPRPTAAPTVTPTPTAETDPT